LKRLLFFTLCLYGSLIQAQVLKQVISNPDYLKFIFDAKPALINNSYLSPGNSLVLDFAKLDNKTDLATIKHALIDDMQLANSGKLTRVLIKFNRQVTYRVENKQNSLWLYINHKQDNKLTLSPTKTETSLRWTLKNLAEASGIDLVISDKIKGEAIMQIKDDTDPQEALYALVAANNLELEKSGALWLITLPQAGKKPAAKTEAEFSTSLIALRYAKASDLVKTMKSAKNTLLSSKGSVSADERTNSLLINDTEEKTAEIKTLISQLDKPRKQVLIRSKIVIATDDFAKSLGVRFGISHYGEGSGIHTGLSGNANGSDNSFQGQIPNVDDRFNINLPAANPTASVGLVIAKLPFGTMLDLELSASQLEGKTKIVASPHVMTADGATAYIQQGVEIPYRTETSEKIDVKFKEALMELRVNPRITPHNHIILELIVKKDAVGSILCQDCEPSIDTREVKTKVRIRNGETLVIGGIAEDTISKQHDSVPGVSKIPLLGRLFKSKSDNRNKRELLIFITPTIVAG